jgi:DNA gyrase subunit A
MTSQGTLFEAIKNAIEEEKITDVSYANDESGREASTRIVLELKKGADPRSGRAPALRVHAPAADLRHPEHRPGAATSLRTLSLREMIDCYVEHRVEVIRRRTEHLLREAKRRGHVLEGMIHAVCDLDEVIRLIRSSASGEEAIRRLMERRYRIAPIIRTPPAAAPAARTRPCGRPGRRRAAQRGCRPRRSWPCGSAS